MKEVWIWPEGGIENLPTDTAALEVPALREIEADWRLLQDEGFWSSSIHKLLQEQRRRWSIETGQIENLYDIERGVTVSLIEHGFSEQILESGSTKDPEKTLAILKDQLDALEMLMDLVGGSRALTVGFVRELHSALTLSQTSYLAQDSTGKPVEVELKHGEYKVQDNSVRRNGTLYRYCPAEQVPGEMEKLVAWHNEHSSKQVPIEIQAAWLHHRFTQIHPFADGNGRVARALATLVLLRARLYPVVIPTDEKSAYIDALEAADRRNLRPFTLFLARHIQRFHRAAVRELQSGVDDQVSLEHEILRTRLRRRWGYPYGKAEDSRKG